MSPRIPILVLLACTAAAVPAQPIAPIDEGALQAFVSRQVAGSGAALSRFEVQVGTAPTGQLAPCQRTEPFTGNTFRPWGRGVVGVRCVAGATWTLMVPVTVRAWGPALVAATSIAVGSPVGAADVVEQEVELTREAPGLLRDLAQVQGRTLTRPLQPGQPLRADMFRQALVVQAGDPVRLRVGGAGFHISAGGQALAAAAEGQPVRVRTELGRVLTGVAREGRVVDVTL